MTPEQKSLGLVPAVDPHQVERDAERQVQHAEYTERLRQYLQDPEFRAIEGFPLGADEDILALSDPPYYTACPNPFMGEIIAQWQQEREATRAALGLPVGEDEAYHREPYATDVSEGKNDPIYNAHSYHTKVPHKAIMRYILHYTEPGDIVYDGFCGTGMTGVAAGLCGNREAVQSLGYRIDAEGLIWEGDERISRLGARRAVLNDLSPAATFIACNYNTPVDAAAFQREARRILREVERECGWMYETWHPAADDPNRVKAKINYTVWSDVFVCPVCGAEIVFWQAAVDHDKGKVRDAFPCPACGTECTKRGLTRATETVYDRDLGHTLTRARQVPVLINYSVGKKRHEKRPDADDLALIQRIEASDIPYWFPTNEIPKGDKTGEPIRLGITHVHHFYTRRNLWVLAALWEASKGLPLFKSTVTAVMQGLSKLQRFSPGSTFPNMILSGTLYVGSLVREWNALAWYRGKLRGVTRSIAPRQTLSLSGTTAFAASSAQLTTLQGLNYIFVDPPFGANLMYSELNFLWEAWLKVLTNNASEAIVNKVQRKALPDYQQLMERCFLQFYRALKPGRWMTVEFHNSQSRVWNAIQEALQRAGFVVADVRSLDKQQGSFNQVATGHNAVKQDLIISAYKPNAAFQTDFVTNAGTPQGAWAFVRQHLEQVPKSAQFNQERTKELLYDRMIAYHLVQGMPVPLSAPDFYAGLRQRFIERDTMFFTPEQAVAYDAARKDSPAIQQLTLTLTNEQTTVQWLRQQFAPEFGGHPQTYAELQPAYLQQLHLDAWEKPVELRDLLADNFVQDPVGRWRVPDPNDVAHLEQRRHRALLREFEIYTSGHGKLQDVRSEAVRAGFEDCYQRADYETIAAVAERLPAKFIEADDMLTMLVNTAHLMLGAEEV